MESIIEKVIVGGYDENGEKDPYKIIFIYKTGFKNEIGNAKERFGKKSKAVEKAERNVFPYHGRGKGMCSYVSDNTRGDSSTAFPQKPDGHINVKVEFGEGEGKVPLDNIAKRAESYKPKERVTYKMIKGVHRS